MSLEQAILDRLEKRNAQIAQLQSMVHALERAADSQREHAMMERGRLLEENKKLAERIGRMKESEDNADALLQEVTTDRDRLQNEIVRLNAKLGPLEALYKTLKGYHDSDKIIGHGSIIKVAIDVATEALSQLTA